MTFSKRMDSFKPGVFSALAAKKAARERAGADIIDLSVGTPNIPPAPHIIRALCESAAKPENYIYALGDTAALRAAAAGWYARRYDVALDPETQVVSLLGSQDGLAHLALAIVNPGDLALVQDPGYPIFGDGPLLAGAELYRMPQRRENGWLVDLDAVPPDVAARAKYMVISYPNNPVCAVAPPAFYKKLVAFAKQHHITVLHDNAYSELVFEGARGGSFLQTPGAADVGVEFNSLSKTYGLAGARIGFALGNRDIIAALKALKSNIDYGMFLPIQQAAIAALTGPQDCVAATREAYRRRRDILVDGLCAAGWHMGKPPATMFVWATLPKPFHASAAFTEQLLARAGVLVTPGAAFGPGGEGYVRLALVQKEARLREAVRRIAKSGLLRG